MQIQACTNNDFIMYRSKVVHMMQRVKFENDISNKQQLKCLIGIINIIVMEIQFCI